MKAFRIILNLFFIVPSFVFSQTFTFKYFTVNDGLLDNNIYRLTADSFGRLIICSKLGVSLFNGKTSTVFKYPDHKTTHTGITVVNKNNIICIPEVKGILTVKNLRLDFRKFHDSLFESTINEGYSSHGYPTIDPNGNIYFNCNHLYFYSNNIYKIIRPKFFIGTNYTIESDRNGNIYVETNDKLYFLSNGVVNDSIVKLPITSGRFYNAISTGNSSYFIFDERNDGQIKFKIFMYNRDNRKLRPIQGDFEGSISLKLFEKHLIVYSKNTLYKLEGNRIISKKALPQSLNSSLLVHILNDSVFYFFKKNKILIVNANSSKILDEVSFLKEGVNIQTAFSDKENNLWIGTDNGLFKIFPNNYKIYTASEHINEFGKLFYIDHNNNSFYIKAENENRNDIYKYDINSQSTLKLGTITGNILSILEKNDTITLTQWSREKEDPLARTYNPFSNYFTNTFYRITNSKFETINIRNVVNCSENSNILDINKYTQLIKKKQIECSEKTIYFDGNVWTTNSIGPLILSGNPVQFAFPTFEINQLSVYQDTLYYVNGLTLYKYYKPTHNFIIDHRFQAKTLDNLYYKIGQDKYLLIDSLMLSKSQYLKISNREGLIEFKKISKLVGKDSIKVYDACQFYGKVYLMTNLGFYKIWNENNNLQSKEIKSQLSWPTEKFIVGNNILLNFYANGFSVISNKSDSTSDHYLSKSNFGDNFFGEMRNPYNQPLLDEFGNILLSCKNSITKYVLTQLPINKTVNNIILTQLQITNNDKTNYYSNIDSLKSVKLTFRYHSDISIYFETSSLSGSENVNYRYILSGIYNNWKYQTENHIDLISLSPGTYKLKIFGCNNNGIWCDQAAEIEFEVLPPWYRTLIAYLLYFVCIIISIITFIRVRTQKLKNEKKKLEFIVSERTAEIVAQKHEIEEKQKDIMDSIKYARRIQTSLLPTEKYIERIISQKKKK